MFFEVPSEISMVSYCFQMWVRSLCQEDPLGEGMATHSSIFACKSHEQKSLVGYNPMELQKSWTQHSD